MFKLLSGGLVFKIESPHGFRQWYYDRLLPDINYISVKPDMSDLLSKIEDYKKNDEKARSIAAAGRALAMTMDYELERERASQLLRGQTGVEASFSLSPRPSAKSGVSMAEQSESPRSAEIFHALEMLTPFETSSYNKIRAGAPHDGGYVIFDDLAKIEAVFSFGLGGQVEFDDYMASLGKKVFMYDHTIEGLPYQREGFFFRKEGIDGIDRKDQPLSSLVTFLTREGYADSRDLFLKIDVEGAEYDALASTPSSYLSNFRQIAMEVHGLANLGDEKFRLRFISMFSNLLKSFVICHVHANNCAPITIVDGYVVADVLELTLLRKDVATFRFNSIFFPTLLDEANAWWRNDHLLWFFPFVPMYQERRELTSAAAYASLQASRQTLAKFRKAG